MTTLSTIPMSTLKSSVSDIDSAEEMQFNNDSDKDEEENQYQEVERLLTEHRDHDRFSENSISDNSDSDRDINLIRGK
jgi:hypothetical protein